MLLEPNAVMSDIKAVAVRVYRNYSVWPGSDSPQCMASFVRDIVNELQYYQCTTDESVEDWVVDSRKLYELADALDEL